ncbi:MAG: hypothetical protein KDI19_06830 [Pseudomonadales bacterium]|nr:hypothetical protein [Pseudomonadales bacterium]
MSSDNIELATVLNSAVTHLSRRIRRIDDAQDIGRARLSALSVLVFGGPRTLSELAADEMVSPATMHHVVNGLVKLRLATRRTDADDKRKTRIEVTLRGRQYMEDARQARLDFYTAHLDKLSAKERSAVAEFARLADDWVRGG